MRLVYSFLTLAICALVVSACHDRNPGPMERAGERVDEITDNVREGKPLLHRKGPAEKLGETIDESTGY